VGAPGGRAMIDVVAPVVTRRRLVTTLDEALERRLTMVVAPAGYGKTTALLQWAAGQRPDRVAWLTLAPHHNKRSRLARDLSRVRVALAGTSLATLILDDFHVLTEPSALDECAALVEQVPDGFRLVLASRGDPPPTFYRWWLTDALAEIGQGDLAFTREEVAGLVAARGELRAEPEIDELMTRTEGWAAGLVLTADGVDDYLTHQVLDRLPDSARRFLMLTSGLDRLSGPLCDFVTAGRGSQAMVEQLEGEGAFVSSLDSRRAWFRCHPMLRDLLWRRLQEDEPDAPKELLHRAAEWHLGHGHVEAGISCLIRADAGDEAVEAAIANSSGMYKPHQLGDVARWTARAADSARDSKAEAFLLEAASLLFGDDLDGARSLLATVDEMSDITRADKVVADLLGSYLAVMEGTTSSALAAAERVLENLADVDDAELPNLLGLTGSKADVVSAARVAHGVALMYDGALASARDDLAAVSDDCHGVWRAAALGGRALVEAWSGNLNAGEQFGHRALALADALGHGASSRTTAWLALALVARARGDIDGAAALLDQVDASGGGDRRVVAMWLATERAYLALARNVSGAARAMLGGQWASPHPAMPEAVLARRRAAEALVLIASGDLDDAEGLLRVGLGESSEVMTARVRLAVERGDVRKARVLVESWPGEPQPGARRERQLWAAVVEHLEGDAARAGAGFAAVVADAESEGDVGVFHNAGSIALGPARALYRTAPSVFLRSVVDQPVVAGPAPPVGGLVEQLTDREYMVLVHLPSRESNAEIAERLGVSLNTVKTHLKHIYRKLNVAGRSDAVAAAERFHLL